MRVEVLAIAALIHQPVFPTYAPAQQPSTPVEVRSILRQAGALVPEIDAVERSPAAWNVAAAQVRIGDLDGALSTAQANSEHPDERTLVCIAESLADQGSLSEALQLIEGRIEERSRPRAYEDVAHQLAFRKNFTEALNVARRLSRDPKETGRFIAALMVIYHYEWRAEDRAGAAQVLNEAMLLADEKAKQTTISKQDLAGLYFTIIYEVAQAKDPTTTRQLIARMKELVERASSPTEKRSLLAALGRAQGLTGDITEALSTAEALPPEGERDAILGDIASVQIQQGASDAALATASALSQPSTRAMYSGLVAEKLSASNNDARALSILNTIPSAQDRAFQLSWLAMQQAERGDPAAADTVERAWELAKDTKFEANHSPFQYIAVTRAMLGDLPAALAILSNMDEKSRPWLLRNLTEMMVVSGKKKEALSLANSQTSALAKVYALMGVAAGLIERGSRERESP